MSHSTVMDAPKHYKFRASLQKEAQGIEKAPINGFKRDRRGRLDDEKTGKYPAGGQIIGNYPLGASRELERQYIVGGH